MRIDVRSAAFGVNTVNIQLTVFDHNIAVCLSKLNKLRYQIKTCVKVDRQVQVASVAAEAQRAASIHDSKQLHKLAKDLTPQMVGHCSSRSTVLRGS